MDITEEQKQKIDALIEKFYGDISKLVHERKILAKELNTLYDAEPLIPESSPGGTAEQPDTSLILERLSSLVRINIIYFFFIEGPDILFPNTKATIARELDYRIGPQSCCDLRHAGCVEAHASGQVLGEGSFRTHSSDATTNDLGGVEGEAAPSFMC